MSAPRRSDTTTPWLVVPEPDLSDRARTWLLRKAGNCVICSRPGIATEILFLPLFDPERWQELEQTRQWRAVVCCSMCLFVYENTPVPHVFEGGTA